MYECPYYVICEWLPVLALAGLTFGLLWFWIWLSDRDEAKNKRTYSPSAQKQNRQMGKGNAGRENERPRGTFTGTKRTFRSQQKNIKKNK